MAATKIGALWKKQGPKGPFYSGVIENKNGTATEIVIFPNGFKAKDIADGVAGAERKPDLMIYLSEPREQAPAPAPAKDETPDVPASWTANPGFTSDGNPVPNFDGTGSPDDLPPVEAYESR